MDWAAARHADGADPDGRTAAGLAFTLAALPALTAIAMSANVNPVVSVVVGLLVFGVVFATSSAVHSYLILAYADGDRVAGLLSMLLPGRAVSPTLHPHPVRAP